MAEFELNFPENFMGSMLSCNTEDMVKEMIDEASPILVESMKKEMKSVIQHDGDSDMVNSVIASKAKKAKNGAYISFIGPKGSSKNSYYADSKKKRSYPVSNVLKAIWLNYGRKGQSARPFLTKATNSATNRVIEKMQDIYNRKTGENS